jgi:hypothetical protein
VPCVNSRQCFDEKGKRINSEQVTNGIDLLCCSSIRAVDAIS